jgi:hypothetical protein
MIMKKRSRGGCGLEQQIVQKENELIVLLGRNPEDVTRGRSDEFYRVARRP